MAIHTGLPSHLSRAGDHWDLIHAREPALACAETQS